MAPEVSGSTPLNRTICVYTKYLILNGEAPSFLRGYWLIRKFRTTNCTTTGRFNGCSLARKSPIKTSEPDPIRCLKERGGRWHYVRRVPAHSALVDDRKLIQIALKTQSLEVAKLRRDAQEKADDLYWQSLAAGEPMERAAAVYEAAKARLRVLGFEYRAAADIADRAPLDEIMRRLELASVSSSTRDQAAIMGRSTSLGDRWWMP